MHLDMHASHADACPSLRAEGETKVAAWLARGKSNRDIADILSLSYPTINKQLEIVFAKLNVENPTAAALFQEAMRERGVGLRTWGMPLEPCFKTTGPHPAWNHSKVVDSSPSVLN